MPTGARAKCATAMAHVRHLSTSVYLADERIEGLPNEHTITGADLLTCVVEERLLEL
ncbi:hypothetical protein PYCC9005_003293 [Savitreella phatthalungensis]